MHITEQTLPRIIDVSIVKSHFNEKDVHNIADACKRHKFICAFALNTQTPLLKSLLNDQKDVMVGYTVGYPSGGDTTACKLFQVREAKELEIDEIDCVINVGQLRSGNYKFVQNDIDRIVKEAEHIPVKVIIEAMLLTDDEIKRAAEIVMQSGAKYIKTGTGWMPKPTTLHHIKLLKETVGNKILIKAAGGIKGIDTIINMTKLGVSRFGMSYESALKVIEEIKKYPQGFDTLSN